ncbi:HAD-IIIC family phosphatase [Oleispirillum naphthae]|uniref:HAD-IIIC family phosphatase n=1 Tax=Oleispirillum naphthae TaxID=2838853 RepID=UPI0030825C25
MADFGLTHAAMSAIQQNPQSSAVPSYSCARAAVERLPAHPGKRLRIVLGGNCTMDFLIPGLKLALADEGYGCDVAPASFDGWIPEALSGSVEADVWVVWVSTMGVSVGGSDRRSLPVAAIAEAASAILKRGQKLIFLLPEAAVEEDDPASPVAAWRRGLCETLRQALPSGTVTVDPDCLQRRLGIDRWHAGRYWSTAKAPCHPDAMTALGAEVAVTIARCLAPRIKAVVVDLDNTLWDGVVGEDGVENLELDANAAGRPHLHLQRFLKDLSLRGVPLAVVSKNNRDDAVRPFLERPEMILRLDDFVAFEASWEHKSAVIARLVDRLSLLPSAVCFLDDSPRERAEVRAALPELAVFELDDDPELWVDQLVRSRLFAIPAVGNDDALRVKDYRAEIARRRAADEMGVEAFLSGLEMKLRPMRIDARTFPRVVSLVHKTNQFNLTNRRHGPAAIKTLVDAPENYAYCFEASDRFGPAGIVGVLIATPEGGGCVLDTWLLSCRVLSRGFEFAMIEHLQAWLAAHGGVRVIAPWNRSGKNALLGPVLDGMGFTPDGEVFVACPPAVPAHHCMIVEDTPCF